MEHGNELDDLDCFYRCLVRHTNIKKFFKQKDCTNFVTMQKVENAQRQAKKNTFFSTNSWCSLSCFLSHSADSVNRKRESIGTENIDSFLVIHLGILLVSSFSGLVTSINVINDNNLNNFTFLLPFSVIDRGFPSLQRYKVRFVAIILVSSVLGYLFSCQILFSVPCNQASNFYAFFITEILGVERRAQRDLSNPFELLETEFRKHYRLGKALTR